MGALTRSTAGTTLIGGDLNQAAGRRCRRRSGLVVVVIVVVVLGRVLLRRVLLGRILLGGILLGRIGGLGRSRSNVVGRSGSRLFETMY